MKRSKGEKRENNMINKRIMEKLGRVYLLISSMASEAANAARKERMDHARDAEPAGDIVK